MMKPINWNRVFSNSIYIVGIILIYFTISYLLYYILPFFLAFILAYILNPVINFFQTKLKLKYRIISIICAFTILFSLIILLEMLIAPYILSEIQESSSLLLNYFEDDSKYSNSLAGMALNQIQNYIDFDFIKKILESDLLEKSNQDLFSLFSNTILVFIDLFKSSIFVILFTIYLIISLVYYKYFVTDWKSFIPPVFRKNIVMIVSDLNREFGVFYKSQAKIVAIQCVLFTIAFIIIDLPLAIILGILAGFLNFIPYLQLITIPPALILISIKAVENDSPFWVEALIVFSVFGAIQLIEDAILVPNIIGKDTGLNPALILLSLSIFGGLFGLVGLIVAIPLTNVLIYYYKIFILKESMLI